jgi:hypothetical protein
MKWRGWKSWLLVIESNRCRIRLTCKMTLIWWGRGRKLFNQLLKLFFLVLLMIRNLNQIFSLWAFCRRKYRWLWPRKIWVRWMLRKSWRGRLSKILRREISHLWIYRIKLMLMIKLLIRALIEIYYYFFM